MGGLFGEPLELVKCETSDVLVPAHAEMVIEGEILPGERTAEGPSASSPAIASASASARCCTSRAITHRAGAMFQDITVAHLDHMLLSTIPMEANLYRAVRAMVPSVKAVRVPRPFTCYVSIEQRLLGPGQERDPRRARRRPLHEARGGGRPRRGHLRRPADDVGHRHALPARSRHHRHHPCARLGPRPLDRARTATRASGASTPRPSPRSPPIRRATACRPTSTSDSISKRSTCDERPEAAPGDRGASVAV